MKIYHRHGPSGAPARRAGGMLLAAFLLWRGALVNGSGLIIGTAGPTPATAAGLRRGDVIAFIDGRRFSPDRLTDAAHCLIIRRAGEWIPILNPRGATDLRKPVATIERQVNSCIE